MAKQIKKRIERIVDYDKMQKFYTNCSMVSSSLYDFTFLFGKFHAEGTDKIIENYEQVIYMNPQQAKALLKILHQHVSGYETNFGEIKLPVK